MTRKKTDRLIEQDRDHNTWTIVELFYRSHITFREQFNRYEERVLQHSYQKGLHRLDLRLGPDDLAGLLDFKALERLRDEFLQKLKDLCHVVFRGKDRTDVLDRYVSDIFHEISILKEEHYNVKTYAPQYARDAAEAELAYILDEAHVLFPQKLNHVNLLFRKGQARMEELLASFTSNTIFIRSLYLSRADFVKDAYEDGILQFYRFMYPELGPVEGFYGVGMSFFRAGFYSRALEAFQYAEREFQSSRPHSPSARKLDKLIRARSKQLVLAEKFPGGAAASRLDVEAGFKS